MSRDWLRAGGGLVGGAIGTYFGGPMGAMMGSSLGSGIGGMFAGSDFQNPADVGIPWLEKIPGEVAPYYNPYINAGRNSLGILQGQYKSLVNDPGSVVNRIGESFQQSPGYDFAQKSAQNAAMNAAAAGGYTGGTQHQNMAANIATNMANQDYYNWLGNAMGMYNRGLSGYEGINQMGYNASDSLAQLLAAVRLNQAAMAYGGTREKNVAQGQQANASQGMGSMMGNIFRMPGMSGGGGGGGGGGFGFF